MATQSANACPLHELDKSTVSSTEVQAEVMKRLQSSMNIPAKAQATPNKNAALHSTQ